MWQLVKVQDIAYCALMGKKYKAAAKSNLAFIWVECCHLMLYLSLMQPNLKQPILEERPQGEINPLSIRHEKTKQPLNPTVEEFKKARVRIWRHFRQELNIYQNNIFWQRKRTSLMAWLNPVLVFKKTRYWPSNGECPVSCRCWRTRWPGSGRRNPGCREGTAAWCRTPEVAEKS